MTDKAHELLHYWFGDPGSADLPTSERTNLWFGDNDSVKKQLVQVYKQEFEEAKAGGLQHWEETPRSRLALIIILDQFPRYLYQHTGDAFLCDERAQKICAAGLQEKMDQTLTLIERVFFYMPLVHSEDAESQEQSIRLYQELVTLSMPETTQIYQLFLAYAYAHFRVIKEFGRFPQRNIVLNRTSTPAELAFLKNT